MELRGLLQTLGFDLLERPAVSTEHSLLTRVFLIALDNTVRVFWVDLQQKASGWQAHSVRGFLSGTVGKKMGLTVVSTKGEDGERSYSVKA